MCNQGIMADLRKAMRHKTFPTLLSLVLLVDAALATNILAQEQPLDVVSQTNFELADSQKTVDQLNNAANKMLQEYRAILQQKDYQQYYNFQLKQQKASQEQEIAKLKNQLLE